MIRPANFGYNPETAANNTFQQSEGHKDVKKIREKAMKEFDAFVSLLRGAGITVYVMEDTPVPLKYDAVFPNNWFTTHQDGALVTYPMFSETRRLERRDDIVGFLSTKFRVDKRIHLEDREELERYLEGTGSMIFDRVHRIVYACRSIRTDEGLLDEFILWMGYEKVIFEAYDANGIPIYHTNVMMALGDTFSVICLESITDAVQRRVVTEKLTGSGKEIIAITRDQMSSFAGNMLQVENKEGESFLVMSTQAYKSLREDQIRQIERHTGILHSPIDTIENFGGGSARCMIAEIFLPEKRKR